MWKCPRCNREFIKINQMHSCKLYPVNKHFENKEDSMQLYEELLKTLKKEIGPYKIESLPCCIHVLDEKTNYTYACVYAIKDGIKLHITLDNLPRSNRIKKAIKIGKNKYKYEIFIKTKKEIDKELIAWLKESDRNYANDGNN
jgi:phage host-nuclease inhibitor protein Gam